MELVRENKSWKTNKNIFQPKTELIDIDLNNNILSLMCKMVISENKHIRRTQLNNLRLFVSMIDPKNYNSDVEKSTKMDFIKKGIEARLKYNLIDRYMILSHINGGILDGSSVNPEDFDELSTAEVDWLCNMISESLQYSHIYAYIDMMIDVCTDFKTAEYGQKGQAVKKFEEVISTVQNGLRKRRNESLIDQSFSLRPESFDDTIRETYAEISDPKRKLVCGMQAINDMTNGGFEATRCYVFFGLPGEGKSTMLMNLAYQIKKYNKGFKPKDPTKRPCVVLLTMENLIDESVERMFSISTGRNGMIHYTPDDIIRMMREEGELNLSDSDPIDIIIKFKNSNSCDTSYLYTLAEDLEDDGLEMICLIQDYIGRIRSTERYSDTRLEYGAVVDEFKSFAEAKRIPVITASQLNRDASKHIDEAKQKSKNDLVKLLGRSNISESMLILNNADAGFMLAPEYTRTGEKYMGVQDIKHRYYNNPNAKLFVYIPFFNDTNKLVEDFYGAPCYRTTMKENPEFNSGGPKISSYHINMTRADINEIEDDEISFNTRVYSEELDSAAFITLINPLVYLQPACSKLIDPLVYENEDKGLIDPLEYLNPG